MSRSESAPPPDQTIDELIGMLKDKSIDLDARARAVMQLGNSGDSRAVAPLVDTLRSEERTLRFLAAEALARLGGPAVPSLIAALDDTDGEVRFWAARSLGRIGDTRALQPLLLLEGDAGETSGGARVEDAVATAIRSLRNTLQATQDPWDLVSGGQYRAAIAAYSDLYRVDGHVSHLRNRGLVRLFLGEGQAALDDFSEAIAGERPERRDDITYLFQGICYWYLNQPDEAVAALERSLAAPYSDAAGGVEGPAILLYAGERLRNATIREKALKHLRAIAARRQVHWPGCIAPFLLERIDIGDLEEQVQTMDSATLRARWQCQADFYIALRALREGKEGVYRARVSKCAEAGTILEPEYHLARWEVRNGFPIPHLRVHRNQRIPTN